MVIAFEAVGARFCKSRHFTLVGSQWLTTLWSGSHCDNLCVHLWPLNDGQGGKLSGAHQPVEC